MARTFYPLFVAAAAVERIENENFTNTFVLLRKLKDFYETIFTVYLRFLSLSFSHSTFKVAFVRGK